MGREAQKPVPDTAPLERITRMCMTPQLPSNDSPTLSRRGPTLSTRTTQAACSCCAPSLPACLLHEPRPLTKTCCVDSRCRRRRGRRRAGATECGCLQRDLTDGVIWRGARAQVVPGVLELGSGAGVVEGQREDLGAQQVGGRMMVGCVEVCSARPGSCLRCHHGKWRCIHAPTREDQT